MDDVRPQQNQIQWFPGHMAKTRRIIKESLKQVDAVAEIVDARIPFASRNPEIDEIIINKPRIMLLNKSDIADTAVTALWISHYNQTGAITIPVDCRSGKGMNQFLPAVKNLLSEKIAAYKAKGMSGKALRVMVVGVPNVGKSSFINRMAKNTRAKVEDRPGVTRGNQWYTVGKELLLLDTPGVLWPKFEDEQVGLRLALTGAIKDSIMDVVELAYRLLLLLAGEYPALVAQRYGVDVSEYQDVYDAFLAIGKRRGMLMPGGCIDENRTAVMLLDEFRGGMIGQISLEKPN